MSGQKRTQAILKVQYSTAQRSLQLHLSMKTINHFAGIKRDCLPAMCRAPFPSVWITHFFLGQILGEKPKYNFRKISLAGLCQNVIN